ncbi:MAG: hypothetical protein GY820_34725 [Gammaproteobacteria bacterium]|nr:hypothetical protein [Gammaproteobacteria bacterium]
MTRLLEYAYGILRDSKVLCRGRMGLLIIGTGTGTGWLRAFSYFGGDYERNTTKIIRNLQYDAPNVLENVIQNQLV